MRVGLAGVELEGEELGEGGARWGGVRGEGAMRGWS